MTYDTPVFDVKWFTRITSASTVGQGNPAQGAKKAEPLGLEFRINWCSLLEGARAAPDCPGIYFLGTPFRLAYGQTYSRIFYVGSSLHLRSRLQQHLHSRERGNFFLDIIADETKQNISCSFHPFETLTQQPQILALEAAAYRSFGLAHGFVPYGNWMPVEFDHEHEWRGPVVIIEPETNYETLTIEAFAERFNLQMERDRYPVFAHITATILESGVSAIDDSPSIYRLVFTTKRTLRLPREARRRPTPACLQGLPAECPYCHAALPKVPISNAKCRTCSNSVYVRMRPQDKSFCIVTKAQADALDDDWSVLSGVREPNLGFVVDEEFRRPERESLAASFARKGYKPPSEDDVTWGLLQKRALEDEKTGHWGIRSADQILMGDFLTRRWKLNEALGHYIYASILDLNDPKYATVGRYVIDIVRRIKRKLQLSEDELRSILDRHYGSKTLSLSADECWARLVSEISRNPG
jgi:hypothetical protein